MTDVTPGGSTPAEAARAGHSMNTRCPHCHTVFRLAPDTLARADGRVRCGQCRQVFDARSHLQQELGLEGEGRAQTPSTDAPNSPTHQPPLRFERAADTRVSGVLLSDLEAEPAPAPRQPASRRSIMVWSAVNTLLLLTLFAQLVFAQRDAFAQHPDMRPLLVDFCALAGCSLEPRSAVERIELVRRNVYSHPNVDDALIIDAKFVNNAPFPQPYPLLTVSLGDLRGEPLIRRNFRPREYKPELDPNARMAPGAPVQITLEVRDPGRDARTFELDFS